MFKLAFSKVSESQPDSGTHYKASQKVVAKDRDHLEQLIEEAIEEQGDDADLNFIDTSNITDMSELFQGSDFNGDISGWDVSSVRTMNGMFQDSSFNRDISKWDTSNVEDAGEMF